MNELQVEVGRVLTELKECCRLADLMWTEENPGAPVGPIDSCLKDEVNYINFLLDLHRIAVDKKKWSFIIRGSDRLPKYIIHFHKRTRRGGAGGR